MSIGITAVGNFIRWSMSSASKMLIVSCSLTISRTGTPPMSQTVLISLTISINRLPHKPGVNRYWLSSTICLPIRDTYILRCVREPISFSWTDVDGMPRTPSVPQRAVDRQGRRSRSHVIRQEPLTHQHVVNHLEGLGTDTDAATVGIIHEEQEMDLQSEEHSKKSRHPQVHGKVLGLKEPAHGEAQHRSHDDESPQRPWQMRGDAVQPQAALFDEVVIGAKGLKVQRLLALGLGFEGLQFVLKRPQSLHPTRRNDSPAMQHPGYIDFVAGVLTQFGLERAALGLRITTDVAVQRCDRPGFERHGCPCTVEAFPYSNGNQPQHDAVEDGDRAQIVADDFVVQGHGVQAGHPFAGKQQTAHSCEQRNRNYKSAKQPVRPIEKLLHKNPLTIFGYGSDALTPSCCRPSRRETGVRNRLRRLASRGRRAGVCSFPPAERLAGLLLRAICRAQQTCARPETPSVASSRPPDCTIPPPRSSGCQCPRSAAPSRKAVRRVACRSH